MEEYSTEAFAAHRKGAYFLMMALVETGNVDWTVYGAKSKSNVRRENKNNKILLNLKSARDVPPSFRKLGLGCNSKQERISGTANSSILLAEGIILYESDIPGSEKFHTKNTSFVECKARKSR
jgi:hypothetical protein